MRGQPVLGMLIASLVDLYQDEWLGAVDAARARDAGLITFVGRELGQPQGFEAAANAVYDLVSAEQLDGLIVWTTSLAQFVGPERMEELCARFGDLPIASLEQSLPGIPSILMGDRNGMKEAVAHLIDVHGHRRIAFVRGAGHHLGAHQRYLGYVDALEEHGLPLEEELLGPKTSFYSPAISAWIEEQLSDRGRRPHAIAVAHDDWALGVLSVLRASGTSVPQDIAVVGFDDVIGVRRHGLWLEGAEGPDTLALVDLQAAMLPLTTVHAPFRELGAHAVDSLLARLRGESVPPVETVPARLVVRDSCGCMPTRRDERRARAPKRAPPDVVGQLATAVDAAVGVPHRALPIDLSQRLAHAFVAEIRGEAPGQFLATFGDFARTPQLGIPGLLTGFAILAALREAAGSIMTDEEAVRAEAIWPRAEGLLEQIADRVVVGIEPMLRRLIGEDVELVVELAPSLQPIRADQGQIEQVIVNLTLNARDAMPTGGRLRISTADIVRDETLVEQETAISAGDYVLLAVSDTGVGMDPETQARVFDPFFTTKSLGRGTGLGLATVFGIVRQSGGHIDVESTPGEGSTFRVYLPQSTRAGETEIEAAPTPGGRGFETILLVEDEPNVRGAVRRFLEQRGYHVVDASSGAEALRLFELNEQPIDLVVTDVVMPETSGPELIERLGQIGAGIPVLYISGYTAGVISRQGLAEGTVALLEKPFTAEQLARKVRELLDRRRPAEADRETG